MVIRSAFRLALHPAQLWNRELGTSTFFCNQQAFFRDYHSVSHPRDAPDLAPHSDGGTCPARGVNSEPVQNDGQRVRHSAHGGGWALAVFSRPWPFHERWLSVRSCDDTPNTHPNLWNGKIDLERPPR